MRYRRSWQLDAAAEAQFMTSPVWHCRVADKSGIPVLAYGVRTDSVRAVRGRRT